MNDTYLSIQEISKLLNIAPLTVRRWIKQKKLKAVKAGKQWRILKSDLALFLNE